MAYFEKDFEENFQYSYYGVNGIILGDYVNPEDIEAYIEDEIFYEAVKNGCGKRQKVFTSDLLAFTAGKAVIRNQNHS